MKESFVVTENDLKELAKKVLDTLSSLPSKSAKVLFLEGDLGAGKTTFTKELASCVGVSKDSVHSPTFILKKEYEGEGVFKKIIHIDAYRIENKKETEILKLEDDLKDSESLIVIEWPSRLYGTVNEDMTISFSFTDDDKRDVSISYINH